jgi:hypothetical protein
VLAVCFNSVKSEMSVDNVVAAINCGGDTYRDPRGIIYEKVFFKK